APRRRGLPLARGRDHRARGHPREQGPRRPHHPRRRGGRVRRRRDGGHRARDHRQLPAGRGIVRRHVVPGAPSEHQPRRVRRHRRGVPRPPEPAGHRRGGGGDPRDAVGAGRHRDLGRLQAVPLQGQGARVGGLRRAQRRVARDRRRRHRARAQLLGDREPDRRAGGHHQRHAQGPAVRRLRPDRQDGRDRRPAVPRDRRVPRHRRLPQDAGRARPRPPARDRAHRDRAAAPEPLDAGGHAHGEAAAGRRAGAGDGRRHRAHARAPRAAAGAGEQLPPRHAGPDDGGVRQAVRHDLHRGPLPLRRRADGRRRGGRRDHDDLGHRAHARDRRPQGARRHAGHDPLAVPRRGGHAHEHRRRVRPGRRHGGGAARAQLHVDPGCRPARGGGRRARRERAHRRTLRDGAGRPRVAARPGRGAAARV
ncbi:MAG: Cell division protein FtsX, partial [uncultured Gemmatimonadaceae bacterium]